MDEAQLRTDRVPRHIAIIMDGNGRWAEARGLERNAGHRAGLDAVREIVRASGELGIDYLTLYAFSNENWNRPKEEVGELMRLLEYYLEEELEEAMENGVRVHSIGRRDRLPPSTRAAVETAEARTRDNSGLQLYFALSYGGRTEIVDAARRIARDVELGAVDPDQLDEKTFASYLYAPEIPDPDLLIRTGNEMRVSNFLLWQIAYTEIHTTEVMWPDFRQPHFEAAIRDYQARERRFGMTSAQVAAGGDDETTGEGGAARR
jgi:undecaprenyl diphosphate synthase